MIRLLGLVLACVLGAGCQTVPMPPPKAGAWLVFLCQASDDSSQPHTLGFYQELFNANQPDLLAAYLQKVTNSTVDVSGTEVYGWFRMTVPTATIAPAVRNNSTSPNRTQTMQDCKSAGVASFLASGKSIDPGNYQSFIAVINVPVDAGQAGNGIVANQFEPPSFYSHEMLHVYGMNHSNSMPSDASSDHVWNLGADIPYQDCWDIMSYATCTYRFNVPNHGGQGPELQIAYRQTRGWVLPSRIVAIDAADPAASTITMAPVSEPSRPEPLMVVVEIPGGARYGVEYRVPTGFDRGIPNAAVVIRELRSDRLTYLVKRQDGRIGWTQGDRFTDAANFLSISVDAMGPQSATVTVNPRYSVAATSGEICGNKYVGQIRSCVPGTVCGQKSSRSCSGWWIFQTCTTLVSTDYFCQ